MLSYHSGIALKTPMAGRWLRKPKAAKMKQLPSKQQTEHIAVTQRGAFGSWKSGIRETLSEKKKKQSWRSG